MVLRDGMNVLPTHWNWHPAMFDMYLFTPLSQLRIVLHCIWLLVLKLFFTYHGNFFFPQEIMNSTLSLSEAVLSSQTFTCVATQKQKSVY